MKHKLKKKDFLTYYIPKTSNFYGLLKIRKSEEIKIVVEIQKSKYIAVPSPSDL